MSASPFTAFAYGNPSVSAPPDKDWMYHLSNFTLPISLRARRHLTKVYLTVFLTVALTALGSLVHLRFHLGGLLTHLLSLGLLAAIGASTFTQGSQATASSLFRGVPNSLLLLCAYGFCQGLSIGPLIELAVVIDPSVLLTAFVLTANIFLCFSLTSLFVPRRSHLALASVLSSSLSFLCCIGLLSLFFPTVLAYKLQLYLGLLVFCGYIVADTQVIIDDAESHVKEADYVRDALKLFMNLIAVFVRLLIILIESAAKKDREEGRKRNRR